MPGLTSVNHGPMGPTQWFLPNGMIDQRPVFAANLFQNWCREVKLWRAAQVGANSTQLISQIVSTLPINSRMEVLTYLESTESDPQSRTVGRVVGMLNRRFGKTDTERAWSWLSSFADFKRDRSEHFKDFWTRFARRVTRLNAHGLNIIESAVFRRETQALRIPDGQLPILLATLATFPNPDSIDSLKSLTVKMYEAHRGEIDSSGMFVTELARGNDCTSSETEEIEFADEAGNVFLLKPKKATKSRNKPCIDES